MKPRSYLFDLIIVRSWWMILVILCCLMIFDLTIRHKVDTYQTLQKKEETLKTQLSAANFLKSSLKEEIASFDDPCWMEMVLMRNLGLIPEGETKIVFE